MLIDIKIACGKAFQLLFKYYFRLFHSVLMMSNTCEKEINNNNNNNPEQKIGECSTNSDINKDNRIDSRKLLDNIFVCSVKNCGKEYRIKLSYKSHLRRRHSDKTLSCDHSECDYVTENKEYMSQHLFKHSDDRPFVCIIEDCGTTFKRKDYLQKHQKGHKTVLLVLKCSHEGCDKTFKEKEHLERHINVKHSSVPKSYECRACGQSFETKGKREYHQKRVHHMSEEPVVCELDNCKREFINRHFFKLHVSSYHSDQVFRCDHSGCYFFTENKDLMIRHAKRHTESRPFFCGIGNCVKAFKIKKYLTNHKKTHSSERFVCNLLGCEKTYKSIHCLNQHIGLVHSTVSSI